jgi:hypothetical protein
MFIQVIQGKTNDKAGLLRQSERWNEDLGPGAKGFLGTTGGVADDGTTILLARFESEADAKANSERPEQGAWWNETAKYYDGEVTFRNCPDVDVTLVGDPNKAGFVQVMQGRCADPARLAEIEKQFMPQLTEMRPDVLGSLRGWDGDHFTEAIYFTSEADARKGEAKMAESGAPAGMDEYGELTEDVTFIDLTDPWLRSP